MFKKLKIGKKLIISFILVSFIASIAGIVSMFMMKNIDAQYSEALVDYGFSQGDIGKTMVELANGRAEMYNIIGFTNSGHIEASKKKLQNHLTAFNDSLAKMKDTVVTPEEQAIYDAILTDLPKYEQVRDQVLKIGDTTDPAQSKQAQELAVTELDPVYDALYQDFSKLFERNVNTGTALSVELTNLSHFCLIFVIVLVVVAMCVSILLGTLVSRGISRPITSCADRLRKLAEGDLTSDVPKVESQDETGLLAAATDSIVSDLQAIISDESYLLAEMSQGNFDIHTKCADRYIGDFKPLLASMRKIRLDLSETLSQITQAADQVSSGSEQVAGGAQALSQGATEQASSIEELAATISEISQQTNDNANNAMEASGKVNHAGDSIDESNRQMQRMIEAIKEISETSGKIGKIIKTIEDIAFQTNILALNAAVEAARAGAAGKGFAVVADEVRSLASKSGEAAKNTTELIESSIRAVDNGTRIAGETAESLQTVVDLAKEASQIVEKISVASKSQSESISQVTTGVDQISSVVQTNSATAEESAAASEELSSQARLLRELVSRFKLAADIATGGLTKSALPSGGFSVPGNVSASSRTGAPENPFGEEAFTPSTALKAPDFASADEY